MIITFSEEEMKYIDSATWICIKENTPSNILEEIRKKDELYFDFYGEHYITIQ